MKIFKEGHPPGFDQHGNPVEPGSKAAQTLTARFWGKPHHGRPPGDGVFSNWPMCDSNTSTELQGGDPPTRARAVRKLARFLRN